VQNSRASEALLLGAEELRSLLPPAVCIAAMRDAFGALARGEVTLPLRQVSPLPDGRGWLGVMPSSLARPPLAATKVITVVPSNSGTELDAHQGFILLFDANDGRCLALLDATTITGLRTAAASALATDILARPAAGDLAILGYGTQAATHLDAIAEVRTLRRVRVWGRDRARAESFARRESARRGHAIEVASDARAAVAGADIVCTVTSSTTPVLDGAWLSPGAHVNAVGACRANHRELNAEAVRRSRIVVDCLASAREEAGDLLLAVQEGAIPHVDGVATELGDVLLGRAAGRPEGRGGDATLTLFKSVGIGIQDLCAAHAAYRAALSAGRGMRLPAMGRRHG
jgi:ornithine cyclodeaminase